jgi:hypothetical protein
MYWLLSGGGRVQSVPCTQAIFRSTVRLHPRSNHPPKLYGKYQQRHRVANQEKLVEKCPLILPAKYLYHKQQGSLT